MAKMSPVAGWVMRTAPLVTCKDLRFEISD